MPNLIVLRSRRVKPKGLNKDQTINEEKIKDYFFTDEFENLKLLNKIADEKQIELNLKQPTLLYPGSGTDILTPLIYIEKLFPEVKELYFIFVDTANHLPQIKTILDDINISFENLGEDKIKFYWREQLITLKHITENIFSEIENIEQFNIYFERKFRIMKDEYFDFEDIVINKLESDGVIISDSGFLGKNLTYYDIPKELSSYHEMVLAQKNK